MNSDELCQKLMEFSNWLPFDKKRVMTAPRAEGTYVIRQAAKKSFGRLLGQSDILYIGSTTSKNGLRQRLMQYFREEPQWTNRRINEFTKKYQMEVAWCLCRPPTNARTLEDNLLSQYLSEHDELPPLNHNGIRQIPANDTVGLKSIGTAKVMPIKGKQT
jgi:hypothetical protein